MTDSVDLRPGFADPVFGSQRAFRTVLEAMSRPGRIGTIADDLDPPAPLTVATAAICLALVDHDTPLWLAPDLHTPSAVAFLRFHCGCPIVDDPATAAFAIADAATVPSLDSFAPGDDAWPETSTTLIVQVPDLRPDGALTLSGPGIETAHRLGADGLRDGIWTEWTANRGLFPCGVDLILVTGRSLAALPRTTTVATGSED